jgi:endonuclease V-like protein UPF0215 family
MLKTIKPEIRIIGWDDAPFAFRDRETLIAGVVCRGGTQIDGLITARIKKDGLDVTDKIAGAINDSVHKEQLSVIMLDGITFGGFNITDINALLEMTGLPVMVIIRERPDMRAIRKSLSRFPDFKKRWGLIKKAGKIRETEVKNRVIEGVRTVYYQKAGMDESACERIINLTAVNSVVPEPVRLAHIICSGIKGMRNLK